jgi:hypothetical protein
MLVEPSAVYRVLDTTLIPAVVRVRACRERLFVGQAYFGRRCFNPDWVYSFKVALMGKFRGTCHLRHSSCVSPRR